ncbi:MAG: MmcQ/YjbR family DNA-binding protein [Oscillospiraceae bacterium]|nr:MmcQ/YjbR family DNA-binding protein [Oscillospiraceae bacterium]
MKTTYADRQSILQFAAETYQTVPDYPWQRTPESAVLRCPNGKWYGLIMPVPRCKVTGTSEEICDILNVKCDPMMLGSVVLQKGFFPAYHMNKNSWISILLDGSVPLERVTAALKMSYATVSGGSSGKHLRTEPKAWLVPANPKYENLAETLAVTGESLWKQSGKFIVGDTLYIYEGKPIGAVTYACEVTEINIPYHFNQGGLQMEKVVRLKLLARYPQTQFPLERLRDYGVASVRGPRGIPDDLLAALLREGTV